MIFDKIKQLEQALKTRFEVFSSFNSEIHPHLYETSQRVMGYDVKKLFDNVYSLHNGFDLLWKNDDLVIGEVSCPRITSIFANTAQKRHIHAFDEFGEEFKKFTRQFYPFDIYEQSLDAVTLTVVKIIDEEHLELWIWNNAGQKYKLKFNSIEEYLEAGVKCKFIICWQYFYIDTEAPDFNDPFTNEWIASDFFDAISRMKTALSSMKEYFPEEDWSYQEKELERVKNLKQ